MASRYLLGLDIGTHTIKLALGERAKHGAPMLLRILKVPSGGLRRGVVGEVAEAAARIGVAFGEVRKTSREALGHIYLGVGSPHVKVQSSVGVVAVSRADYEIYRDDMERAVASSQAVSLPPNRMVLHAMVREFVVDGMRNIQDPLGMTGNRLEVTSMLIDDFAPWVKNLTRCVEMLGGGLDGLILSPLAAARAVLSRNQRELGVVMVDIGFGKTGISVYEEGKLLHAAVFPMGGGNVTNDLAIGLKVPVETAEVLKTTYGSALAKEVGSREAVELAKVNPRLRESVSRRLIAEIIEVRLAEIFELVQNELVAIGKAHRLPGGAVLVGGTAKLPGILELAKNELKLPVQIGVPDVSSLHVPSSELVLQAEDPEYACAAGLLLWGHERMGEARAVIPVPLRAAARRFFRFFVP